MNSLYRLLLLFYFVMFLACVRDGTAQNADFVNFVPVSPNAASLGKFGNIPVSYYSGTPTIEVPLYTIESNKLAVPIKLSYHSGGIKVSELASWVGLGWTLNAGGAVIRNERGLADDLDIVGYLKHGDSIDESSLNISHYYHAAKGWLDLEADEYLFNFPGGTGKFILDQQGNPMLTPHQQLKVYPLGHNGQVFNLNSQGYITGWKIVGVDGVQYFFTAIEETRQIDQLSNNEHITAWNLTSIISSDRTDTISFEYVDAGFTTSIPISQTRQLFLENDIVAGDPATCIVGDPSASNALSQNTAFLNKRLSKIHFRGGYVQFIPSTEDRCEVPGDKFLEKVVVFDKADRPVKEILLEYGYMQGSAILPGSEVPCPSEGLRLMLVSVTESGKSPYRFEYIHDKGLPTRFSAAQDHWGFFNREHSDLLSLVPGTDIVTPLWHTIGTEREANFEYGKQGSLRKVTYPTGGTTEFDYEPHKAVLETLHNFPEFSAGYDVATVPEVNIDVDYGYHEHQIASFVVNYLTTGTVVRFKSEYFNESSGSYIKILNSSDEEIPFELSSREGHIRYYGATVPNGSYRVFAMRIQGVHEPVGQVYPLTILEYNNVTVSSPSSLLTIGGLRIREIVDTDPITGTHQKRLFSYGPGALCWGMKYTSIRKQYRCTARDENGILSAYIIGKYLVFGSNSNYPLSNTQGSPVGYRTVTVTEYVTNPDDSVVENGKTTFEYTSGFEFKDEGFASYSIQGHSLADPPSSGPPGLYSDNTSSSVIYQFPYAPPRSLDWRRGLLLKKITKRRNADGSYSTVAFDRNYYSVSAPVTSPRSVRCGIIFNASIPVNEVSEVRPLNAPMDEVAYSYYYPTRGEYVYLSKSENHVYGQSGGDVMVETEYFYDNPAHLLPNRIVTNASDGSRIQTVTTYAPDYSAGTNFIDALVNANNISAPIEAVTCQEFEGGEMRVSGGVLNTYLSDGTGLISTVSVLETESELLVNDFKFSNAPLGILPTSSSGKTGFSPDDRYSTRLTFPKYSRGKVTEQQKSDDVMHSYIWDEDHLYVIAHVVNAQEEDTAYTGFEDGGTGNWTLVDGSIVSSDALTGGRSYMLAGSSLITKQNLTPGDYKVSYWSKNGSLLVNGNVSDALDQKSGWTLYEHILINVSGVSISGNAVIDDLRLLPTSAQMNTYSYEPLIGVTSMTDPNHEVTYYEYDDAGRLDVVRNADQEAVKKFNYNYMR